jgi:homogentisate 1,2-dioxygenase
MAFMFETWYLMKVTEYALDPSNIDKKYDKDYR